MRKPRMLVLLSAVVLAVLPTTRAASPRVATPSITWDELLPYIASNLQIELDVDRKSFSILVADYPSEPSGIPLYSRAADEFAKILLFEFLANDNRMQSIITQLSDDAEATPLTVHKIMHNARFLSRLERSFERAVKRGNVRCTICQEGFTLSSLEIVK